MTLLLVAIAAGVAEYVVGRAWILLVPLIVGGLSMTAILVTGGSMSDTPIPFAIPLVTAVMALALIIRSPQLRQRADSRSTDAGGTAH